MKRNIAVSSVVLGSFLLLTGCGEPGDDDAGFALSDVEQMTLEEQYQVAGDRYVRLNELFGELQAEISVGEWGDNGGRSEIIPGQGSSLGRAPEGVTRDNSYFFTVPAGK